MLICKEDHYSYHFLLKGRESEMPSKCSLVTMEKQRISWLVEGHIFLFYNILSSRSCP